MFEPFPVRCVQRGTVSNAVFGDAYDSSREQLDGRRALEQMFRARTTDAHVELIVTNTDLFERGKPYVFGLASLTDRVAIVSTARISHPDDDLKTMARLEKLVLHEAGHTLGLPHHDHEECVMRTDPTVVALDSAPETPCEQCHHVMIEQAGVMSRPGQIVLDSALGYLARGEMLRAQVRVSEAIQAEAMDITILNQIAASFLDAGQAQTAIKILQTTLDRAPSFAHAHINLGIALQRRGTPGDLALALSHFDQAVEIEPLWAPNVEPHAAQLRQDLAHAQGPLDESGD
jgi:predicted Zn-dependent protease